MASLPVRGPLGDHLLTPQNAALLVIDYQDVIEIVLNERLLRT